MKPLELSHMPCPRSGDVDPPRMPAGFVDEEVALSLITGPVAPRGRIRHEDLALPADESDFAGWNLGAAPKRAPNPEKRLVRAVESAAPETYRRAQPPAMIEPGIGQPHRGGHRWWIAGVAGALSTFLFTALLLSLSSRSVPLSEEIFFSTPRMPTAKPTARPAENAPEAPALTGIATER